MVRANFPNILFGNQVQKGAAGPSPPTTPIIYSNFAGFSGAATRYENLVEMASETGPLWGR